MQTDLQTKSFDKPHVMVIDDDERIRSLTSRYLSGKGFLITTAVDAADARAKLKYLIYDMLILDVMMPGEDGLSLMRSLKEDMPHLPVLLLTALGETSDRIEGLEAGADDYLAKPFEPQELLLRVNAILRRMSNVVNKPSNAVSLGDWVFNPERGELSKKNGSERGSLTTVEQDLLRMLAHRQNQIVSRDDLAKLSGGDPNSRTIDVQVTRLRKKIEQDPKNPRYLQTVRGQGYILRPDTETA